MALSTKRLDQRDKFLMRLYGINNEDYNNMFKEQSGKCEICGRHQSEINHVLCVDHNHSTGKVRALLCNKCNMLVGIVETSNIRAAEEYINRHK